MNVPPSCLGFITWKANRLVPDRAMRRLAPVAASNPLEHFQFYPAPVKFSEVRLFLRKSHVGSGCSVYTRSENAVVAYSESGPMIPYSGSTIGVTGEDALDGAFPQEKTHLTESGWGTVIVKPL